ncbi:protein Njmu-R1-like isoform X4 [Acipenser ruthenus]|uniref:protein Njmu-R1-like isoform X4 n=1 Tax=Acipenser ruthenus TaxID=7906 RepID=UPI00274071BC|nr:protein Njmu-R1-like isoform X4 [Acipenser ruthenus]
MFTSQSSFQDSVDGDEKDAELETEGCLTDPVTTPQQLSNWYYCLYLYQSSRLQGADDSEAGSHRKPASTPGDEFSLSLGDTNLPAEAESELLSYISRRLSKGALLEGMGNIATVSLSVPEQSLGCYCCLVQQDKLQDQAGAAGGISTDFVICFLGGSEKGLEHFRLELDTYVQGLQSSLSPQLSDLETHIRPYLSSWYEECVMHIQRVVQLTQDKVSFLLHAALSHSPVEVVGGEDKVKKDIDRFLNAASFQGLIHEDTTAATLCNALSEEPQKDVTIDCSQQQPQFLNAGSNRFCESWVQAFLNGADGGNPFLLRQILENFKLKAIQDLNSLKRLIQQAEMNHYALFRCYVFLKHCGNGDVLLQNVKVEHAEMPEAHRIVQVLEEFMYEEGSTSLQ